jgi:hypothetical protein
MDSEPGEADWVMTADAKPAGSGAPAGAGQELSGDATRRRANASREAYVTVMLQLAAEGSVPADVSADDLLSHMPVEVTRGSFYHHFASMGELYGAVLAKWRQQTGSDALTAMQDSTMRVVRDPAQRLQLLREWTRGTAVRDRAIRRWADRADDPVRLPLGARAAAAAKAKAAAAREARRAVAAADAAIIGYTRSALRDLGYSDADAQVWAKVMATVFTSGDITDEEFGRLLQGLRGIAPRQAAGADVQVAAADGDLVLYDADQGDPEGSAAAARNFAATHGPGGAAANEARDTRRGEARRRARRSSAAGG